MIVLDTNVVSEMMRSRPDPAVERWTAGQDFETLRLSAVTIAEVAFGIARLASGRRRDRLTEKLDETVAMFEGRILPFDTETARLYGTLAARAQKAGRTLPVADGYIAATAALTGFAVATRDTEPFEAVGLAVIDPWAAA
ncbi:MAG: type II toxin-antitoxin system VapC family toxin [Bifidobacteriaceae bacterium]|jgi:predicted nucleic acid-binding protein|nr:type II toxin-antitoxin system VapC family toxin [Bifidobacteriaceae bacterium]